MPPRDPFDSAVAEVTGRSARGALHNSAPLDPDKEAEFRGLARETGLPIETVRNAPNEARLAALRRSLVTPEIEAALRAAPRASAWLSRPNNAAVAQDDTSTLTTLATLLFPVFGAPAVGALISQAARDPDKRADVIDLRKHGRSLFLEGTAGLASGVAGAVEGGAEVYDKYGLQPQLQRAFGGASDTGLLALARRRREGWAEVQQAVRPTYRTQFGQDIGAGFAAVPASLGAAGVTFATGNPFAGAAVVGGITGGQSYGEARDEGFGQ